MSDATPGDMNDFNKTIIEEFRANDGNVGGPFEGAPMILITTTGAKSGQQRTTPLVSYQEDGRVFIMASMGGAPKHPAWFHNVKANPAVKVELQTPDGIDAFEATASELPREERDPIYQRVGEVMPNFAEYQTKTDRIIPIVELKRS
jgi:deazaflavin-dependent oxidoreductase (nitroreductase family)